MVKKINHVSEAFWGQFLRSQITLRSLSYAVKISAEVDKQYAMMRTYGIEESECDRIKQKAKELGETTVYSFSHWFFALSEAAIDEKRNGQ